MKAISLWQPWASAIALLLKHNETRGWATRYRGPLAIHAAKRWQEDQKVFANLLQEQGLRFPVGSVQLGCVVAVCWLEDCVPTSAVLPTISKQEQLFGNYGPGRYAWLLRDVVALKGPVQFSGKQGFFEVPDQLLAEVTASDWPPPQPLARAVF